jgi:hypothetical protein
MPIPSGYGAQCCLCSEFFHTKTALDRHDRLNAQKHAAILNKGYNDFSKSSQTDPLFSAICSEGPTVDFKEIGRQIDLAQQPDPFEPVASLFSAAQANSKPSDEVKKFLSDLETSTLMEAMRSR